MASAGAYMKATPLFRQGNMPHDNIQMTSFLTHMAHMIPMMQTKQLSQTAIRKAKPLTWKLWQ